MDAPLSFFTAFAAGLFSFLSPCVLPLVSSCLLLLSGESFCLRGREEAATKTTVSVKKMFPSALAFVLGFTCVFVVMSVLLYGLFALLGGAGRLITVAAALVVIILGFQILFDFIPFLNYEKRAVYPGGTGRFFVKPFVAGLAFGAGWTPCVGPILGSILLMAGQSGELFRAALYLLAYALGLGVPFLLAALGWGFFLKILARIKPLAPVIRAVSGLLVIALGVLMLLGRFTGV